MISQKFSKGDFVKFKTHSPEKCGIIVDVHKCNPSTSKHTSHITNIYPYVYYVLVDGKTVEGPYFVDELSGLA